MRPPANDGTFAFRAGLPGAYSVSLSAYSPLRVTGQAMSGDAERPVLHVSEADVGDLRIERLGPQLPSRVLVRGRVVVDGPAPRFALLADGAGVSMGRDSLDDSFYAWIPEGERRLAIDGLPEGFALTRFRQGSRWTVRTGSQFGRLVHAAIGGVGTCAASPGTRRQQPEPRQRRRHVWSTAAVGCT